ncbi:MAG: nuclear transport factor 2 family protein [Proteobacteria bacterium]|nr:nuclear transport factor 2 family protein [Pseudomonadota bacterium]
MASASVATEPANSQSPPRTDAKQQILDLEKEWTAAENSHDAAVLRRILDDRFVALGTHKTYDKEAFIKIETDGDVDPTASQTITYDAVVIDGDTAVVIGTDTGHGTKDGAAYTVVFKYMATYIRRHGHWLALAEHIVPEAK